jgi:demethylmenaquinone methyltransferase/2-methoxy-6-polyprenyl-1,4-benzoquinol methylase
MSDNNTDFGYQQVPRADKAARVRAVFDSVAPRYDLMNDLMSFGLHRLWKRYCVWVAGLKPGERVLDLAAGSGDLSVLHAEAVGAEGRVICSDINASMLAVGRDRLTDAGQVGNVACVQCDAERLPFPAAQFDCVTIGFGLRNVTDKARALAEMQRVLRPGGRALVLEFSRPHAPLAPLYDLFSFQVLPRLGQLVAGDAASYRYLAESIRKHPDQETLKAMMSDAGFVQCEWFNLAGGIVAVHRGYRA